MTEIRFHSSDPKERTKVARIGPRLGIVAAALLMVAGNLVFLGLMAAPDLVADLGRSADRISLRESARIGVEAFDSVRRRFLKLEKRASAAELFLARVAVVASIPLPAGFLSPGPVEELTPERLEGEVLRLARRLRTFELLRRTIAVARGIDASRIPSRSPVEPSTAVPVGPYGPRVSPLTSVPEFFPGLLLAAPEATPVVAPAAGTVVYAGPAPHRAGSAWRPLGTMIVLAHDERTRTVYGHLGKVLVRAGQRVQRGDRIALVGRSGVVAGFRLHYEVRRLAGGRFVPVDPRLFILDADWIAPGEIAASPTPPDGLDLLPPLR